MQAFYATHGRMTSPGRHKVLLDGLPSGIRALSKITQGLIVHEFLTQQYGFELPDERRATVHARQGTLRVRRLLRFRHVRGPLGV
jgi:transposase